MEANMTWSQKLKAARQTGTPIIAVEAVDALKTGRLIAVENKLDPVIWWDCAAGPKAMTEKGKVVIETVFSDPYQALNLVEALKTVDKVPEYTILLIAMAHRFLEEPSVIQAVLNLRDPFKANGSSLILLLLPGSRLPAELSQDTYSFERPLPTPAELLPVVDEITKAAADQLNKPLPSKEEAQKAAEALVGLSEFAAESALALAVSDGGISPENLWERKRAMVNQTPGLSLVPPGAETFDRVGGLKAVREFGERLFKSQKAPRLVVWVDELEKAISGAGAANGGVGDTSGTSQDQLGVLLRYQEEMGWGGLLMVGPPGSGKSMVAKALGATYQVPTVMLDLGAMKGSLVGQSEQRIRSAMRVIQALAGREAFFVATCNRLEAVPPELRRRYKYGIWFSDLPNMEERSAIWKIHLAAHGFKWEDRPVVDQPWTGAEIRNCCELAERLSITPTEATSYIVPVSKSDPEGVERLRKAADGRFLSVSTPGPYRIQAVPEEVQTKARKLARNY